jgi:hypothetical protein
MLKKNCNPTTKTVMMMLMIVEYLLKNITFFVNGFNMIARAKTILDTKSYPNEYFVKFDTNSPL